MAKKRNNKTRNTADTKKRGSRRNGRDDYIPSGKVDGKDMKCEPATNNDVSWYSASQKLLNDAGRFSFNNPAGVHLPILPPDSETVIWQNQDGNYIPGIATIPMFTGPGVSTDNQSAVNIAAKNLYSYVRFHNSGHANFDAPDLMMYLLACDSAYQWYATLLRLYGTIQQYSSRNRYYSEALVAAQGFDYADLIQHLPDLRYTINRYVRQIGTLCVPGSLAAIKRHAWLYSNVYTDHDDPKAQVYMYTPAGYHFYIETEGPGYLDFVPWHSLSGAATNGEQNNIEYLNYKDIVAICNKFTEFLMSSEDIGIMSGDILKAYGKENLYTLSMIEPDFVVVPSYNQEVLLQIRNATLNCFSQNNIVAQWMDITQDTENGAVLWNPKILSSEYPPHKSKDHAERIFDTNPTLLLDMPMMDPGPNEVMLATRLMSLPSNADTEDDIEFICGTEVACSARVWKFKKEDGKVVPTFVEIGRICSDTNDLCDISVFDEHPHIFCIRYEGTDGWNVRILGDIKNYTIITEHELRKLHEVAILSEWDVPELTVYQS